MNWLKEQCAIWPLWAMVVLIIISVGVFINVARAEIVETRGSTEKGYVRLKSTTNNDGVTTTKGTINGKYVSTKTKDGVTKGTVDGKYVKVKTKTRDW